MTSIDQQFGLRGKVAVVIGGGGYLCSSLSLALADCGVAVTVLDSAEVPSKDLRGVAYARCDVTSKPELQQCCDDVMRRHGRVDILLNGAGVNAPTPFLEITEEEINRILSVHITALIFSCQVFGQVMVSQKGGSIINFASASSGPPLSKAFVYSVAKAGVANLTQNLAREWAPYNVRVNALRPGFFPTEWSMKHFIDANRQAKILGHTPMGRFGKPDELTGAVLWLASDAASFVTGAVVAVDGGFTAMTI